MSLYIREGDLEPLLPIQCTGINGAPDLTTATEVEIRMKLVNGTVVTRAPASVTATGIAYLQLEAGDSDLGGAASGELLITVNAVWPGNRPQTFPPDHFLSIGINPQLT